MKKEIQYTAATLPILGPIMACEEVVWENSGSGAENNNALDIANIQDAEARLDRFRPLIRSLFPETEAADGLIESELREIPSMAASLNYSGKLLLKMDSELPIAGSVKARGGIYEILKLAETVAVEESNFRLTDDYSMLAQSEYRLLFGSWDVVVGSTGNLGLSIGIMSARLGFRVTVHMSSDAKQWKKDMLRYVGVRVVEHPEDYSKAVEEGRNQAAANPRAHFVDDENSMDLFMGYSVAALRLKKQLDALSIVPTIQSPLDVYLPCGVGGAPGGICFGLKQIYEDAVRCWFVEPTHAPCMLLGLVTGANEKISVQDFGIDGRTEADGLAVGRPSGLVGRMVGPLISGILTVDDGRLIPWVRQLFKSEGIFVEPSAAAGFIGPLVHNDATCSVVWATGGRLVPEEIRTKLLGR